MTYDHGMIEKYPITCADIYFFLSILENGQIFFDGSRYY